MIEISHPSFDVRWWPLDCTPWMWTMATEIYSRFSLMKKIFSFWTNTLLASEPAVHDAPEPAGVHRPGGELPGELHHHLRRGQQGQCGQIQALISPNDVTLQALLRRMFGENQVGETWKWDNERMESIMDLQFSFDSDPASSDNEVSCQDLGYPGQVIRTHEVRDAGMVINQRLLMRWRWSFPYTEMIPGLIFN